jgi:hypothetical protein
MKIWGRTPDFRMEIRVRPQIFSVRHFRVLRTTNILRRLERVTPLKPMPQDDVMQLNLALVSFLQHTVTSDDAIF